MADAAFVFAALAVAGLIKGLVGLGLPPISMGLLVMIMLPGEAAAIMAIPAFLTNAWQGLSGPSLRELLRRFGWMYLSIGITTPFFAIALVENADTAIPILGGLLVIYGVYALFRTSFSIGRRAERSLGTVVGIATGVVTGLTGVSSMPSVPFLQATGLGKNNLIQAMGILFSISALSLAIGLGFSGAYSPSILSLSALGTTGAFVGLTAGTLLRDKIDERLFRKAFLLILIVLGMFLIF